MFHAFLFLNKISISMILWPFFLGGEGRNLLLSLHKDHFPLYYVVQNICIIIFVVLILIFLKISCCYENEILNFFFLFRYIPMRVRSVNEIFCLVMYMKRTLYGAVEYDRRMFHIC